MNNNTIVESKQMLMKQIEDRDIFIRENNLWSEFCEWLEWQRKRDEADHHNLAG